MVNCVSRHFVGAGEAGGGGGVASDWILLLLHTYIRYRASPLLPFPPSPLHQTSGQQEKVEAAREERKGDEELRG